MNPSTRRPLACAAAAALAVAALGISTSSPAQASLLPSKVAGLAPLVLKTATDLGAAQPSATQTVTLALALRDKAGLDALNKAQTTPGNALYRHWLSAAQFNARYAPTAAAVAAVTSFATSFGLTATPTSDRTLVTLSGTTAQVNAAFGVVERSVRAAGQTFLTPNRAASLPASVASVTKSVLGLTTFNPMKHPIAVHTSDPYQTYGLGSYGPKDFWEIYHAPAAITGTGQKVGVITQGDLTQVRADLATFQQKNGLPTVPLEIVQAGPVSTDTAGQDEYDLDTQYSTGFAPGVSAVVAFNGATLGAIDPLQAYANQDEVKTASASYGGCEVINYAVGTVDADDIQFQKVQTTGKSLFVSTGDEGSACSILINTGTPAGIPDVEYPSSSPYVVAVGGTSLTGETTQPLKEIAWIGGGGGYSNFESAPSWTTDTVGSLTGFRVLPDVSLDADSFSGYNVIVSGTETAIGGTSASAPAWNGIWARALSVKDVGTAAPALYGVNAGLVDITLGTNGLYAALPGYDQSTGLGSADITALIAAL